ncbi:folylpolyglutamate synthase/dihydrofolate synthase family protein [Inquilinus sp. CAU 1745]|uniref:bifunctional folylpolyglutamate synthase/dihydrofolate synthase n=1 Tax=Inquilinus sp. CAU 1745 TaxID=3140369 RepID=UPI00325B2DDD
MANRPTSAPPTDAEAALRRLKGLHPSTIDLGLDRVHRLLSALGDPHRRLPRAIHVAGTNGKGSTVAFLRAFLEAAGYRVNAYTSPHLIRFNERIRLAGQPIDDRVLVESIGRVEAANEGQPITFFEATTAAAFLAMAESAADVTLLETGLGGRLDATNVLDRPAVTIITPVGMDHMAWLGDSLALIAAEKAGILKPGVPAIIAPQPAEAEKALLEKAAAIGASIDRDWRVEATIEGFRFLSSARSLDLPPPALAGDHQLNNAGAALAALAHLFDIEVPDEAIRTGLRQVEWPGRLERIGSGALFDRLPAGSELWFDAAHNPEGGLQLGRFLRTLPRRPTVLVTGMYYDKRVEGFLAPLASLVDRMVAVEFEGEQPCLPASRLVEAGATLGIPAVDGGALERAFEDLSDSAPARIIVSGSIALVGRALAANAR